MASALSLTACVTALHQGGCCPRPCFQAECPSWYGLGYLGRTSAGSAFGVGSHPPPQPGRWVLLLSSAQLVGLWVPKPPSDALYLLLQARCSRNSPHGVYLAAVILFPDALISTPGAQPRPGDGAEDTAASRCVLAMPEASPWKAEESFLPPCSSSSGPPSLMKLLLSPKLATTPLQTCSQWLQ